MTIKYYNNNELTILDDCDPTKRAIDVAEMH